jgi:outer membrane protein OmpA-like peptidoglycan-associated protein
MKTFKATAIVAGAVLLAGFDAATAQAQPTDAPPAAPAVQAVSVKGVARFDFDRTDVNAADGLKLMSEVRSMKNVTWQRISVVGHTDSIGSDAYNLRLSERRAQAVQAFLIDKGVKPERIRAEGKGKQSPVASNSTADGRAQNRRAEIEFQGLQTVSQ